MQALRRDIFTNAEIITLSGTSPEVEAVCVAGGRILCMGSPAEVRAFAGGGAKEIDLGGGTLYPGFIDSHSHLSSYAVMLDQTYCGISRGSVAGVIAALRAETAGSADDGWILGYGYDDSGIADNRHLSRHDLDEVSRVLPVFVLHVSAHFAYANTRALELLGISGDSHFEGGGAALDENGVPTGFLKEAAAFAAVARIPGLPPERLRANMLKAVAEYSSRGFTTFIDGGIGLTGDAGAVMRAYCGLARENALNARAYLQLLPEVMEKLAPYGLYHFASDYLTLGGLKLFIDGSIQGFTAALLQDYHTRPGFAGALLLPEEAVEEIVVKYHLLGIQVAIHANGDYAVETALRSFEKAAALNGRRDLRHMLIHAQTASDGQLARMRDCGVIPTFFSRHIEVWGDRHARIFLGRERTERLNPAGSCARLGMPFALHVDTPVLPATALGGMHAAVNRISGGGILYGADQRLSPSEALRAYTTGAAMCCPGEHDRGKIEPGRFADFVLLSDNLEKMEPDRLRDVKVKMTISGGRVVYQA
jgi:predicted amidohydrolase YtcJ